MSRVFPQSPRSFAPARNSKSQRPKPPPALGSPRQRVRKESGQAWAARASAGSWELTRKANGLCSGFTPNMGRICLAIPPASCVSGARYPNMCRSQGWAIFSRESEGGHLRLNQLEGCGPRLKLGSRAPGTSPSCSKYLGAAPRGPGPPVLGVLCVWRGQRCGPQSASIPGANLLFPLELLQSNHRPALQRKDGLGSVLGPTVWPGAI